MVLFPRNSKKPKAGDATAEERAAAVQLGGPAVLPLKHAVHTVEKLAITDEMKVRPPPSYCHIILKRPPTM